MDKINKEKEKKVTGKVRGVMKRMNKTYGGSILRREQMTSSTIEKFE